MNRVVTHQRSLSAALAMISNELRFNQNRALQAFMIYQHDTIANFAFNSVFLSFPKENAAIRKKQKIPKDLFLSFLKENATI